MLPQGYSRAPAVLSLELVRTKQVLLILVMTCHVYVQGEKSMHFLVVPLPTAAISGTIFLALELSSPSLFAIQSFKNVGGGADSWWQGTNHDQALILESLLRKTTLIKHKLIQSKRHHKHT